MKSLLAQSVDIGIKNPISARGPLVGINTLSDLINVLFSFIYPFIGVVLLLYFIKVGITILRSNGEKEKIKEAKDAIINLLIGFVLFVAAYFVVKLITYVLGFGGELF